MTTTPYRPAATPPAPTRRPAGSPAPVGTSPGGDDQDDPNQTQGKQNPLGSILGALGGGDGDGGGEGMMLMLLLLFVASMNDKSGGSNILQSILGMLTGNGGGDETHPQQIVKAGATTVDENNLHEVNPQTQSAMDDRTKKTLATAITMASLVDLGNAEHNKGDQAKVAQDLHDAGKFIKFADEHGDYKSLSAATPEAMRDMIAHNKSKRMSVDVTVNGKTETHYFEQMSQVGREDNPAGFAAGAWKEIHKDGTPVGQDGKSDIWLGNPGYTGNLNMDAANIFLGGKITDGSAQGNAVDKISDKTSDGSHNVNPQDVFAAQFAADVLKKAKEENIDVRGFVTGSHSMGVSAMHVESDVLRANGVQVTEIAVDQVGGSHQIAAIREALTSNSELHDKFIKLGISEDVIKQLAARDFKDEQDLNVVWQGNDGKLHKTALASVPVGEGLNKAVMDYKNGQNLGVGNQAAGDSQQLLKLAGNQEFDGHRLINTFLGLEDQNNTILEAGKTMLASNMVAGGAGGGTPPAQPAARPKVQAPGTPGIG